MSRIVMSALEADLLFPTAMNGFGTVSDDTALALSNHYGLPRTDVDFFVVSPTEAGRMDDFYLAAQIWFAGVRWDVYYE